jgi:hypothetical protein
MLIAESFLAMARYEHLPIYKTAMDLTIYLEQVVRNFSRYHKYTLGSDLRQQSREFGVCPSHRHSTAANDPRPSASFSARKHPHRIPANTLPVFSNLRPRI